MSKLSELINKLCPNGVEYKKIKDAFQRLRGTPITASQMKQIQNEDGEITIFAGGKTVVRAKEEDIEKANITRVPAVLVQSRGIIDFIYYDKPFTFKNEMWAYTAENSITVKYLYYVLQNNAGYFREAASGMGSLPQISLRVTEDYLIPLPPLEIQRELVEILDKFAQLTAELTAELQKRKKQYEHYRRALLGGVESGELKVESGYQMVKLGDVCDFVYGYTDKAKDVGDARFIRITDINDGGHLNRDGAKYITLNSEAKKFLLRKGDLLMARTGATYGKTLYYDSEEPAVYASFLIRVIPDDMRLNNRFYWHFSQSTLYWDQAKRLVTAGGQPQFNVGAISQVSIPLPPLAEQERIVAILDRFDSLCNSLTEGLPAEIELRKKQYEYYRDKLLGFSGELRVES